MPKSFVRKTFDCWLEANIQRFRFPPLVVLSRKNYFSLNFSGLASELFVDIFNNGSVAAVILDTEGRYWDIIADFDIAEAINDEGKHYCLLCDDPVFYDSRESLWQEHAFESVLVWVNQISSDDWIFLWSAMDDSAFGADRKTGKPEESADKYVRCFQLAP